MRLRCATPSSLPKLNLGTLLELQLEYSSADYLAPFMPFIIFYLNWWARRDSNPHATLFALEPKSRVSTNSTTRPINFASPTLVNVITARYWRNSPYPWAPTRFYLVAYSGVEPALKVMSLVCSHLHLNASIFGAGNRIRTCDRLLGRQRL